MAYSNNSYALQCAIAEATTSARRQRGQSIHRCFFYIITIEANYRVGADASDAFVSSLGQHKSKCPVRSFVSAHPRRRYAACNARYCSAPVTAVHVRSFAAFGFRRQLTEPWPFAFSPLFYYHPLCYRKRSSGHLLRYA